MISVSVGNVEGALTIKEIGVTTVCFTPALVDYEAHHRRLWSIESVKVNNRKKEKSTDCKPWTISPSMSDIQKLISELSESSHGPCHMMPP